MAINIDADPENADWTKRTWDLPTDADAFLRIVSVQTLEEFMRLPAAGAMPPELATELQRRGLITGAPVSDARPTWMIVLEGARSLTETGRPSFALAELIEYVQRRDASRARTSIQPVVQGMTANAGTGPAQPCGGVLSRVRRGFYALTARAEATAS